MFESKVSESTLTLGATLVSKNTANSCHVDGEKKQDCDFITSS